MKSSWKLNFSLTLTTRKIGLGEKVAGVGVEASSYPIAGASLSVDIYIRIENGCFNMGITHTDKQVLEESSSSFGPFHGTEGVGMETKKDLSVKNGAKKQKKRNLSSMNLVE